MKNKMIFLKSNNQSIIGITGQLHFLPHKISFGGFCPKIRLSIFIFKKPHYFLGFGNQIKHYPIYIKIKNIYDKNIPTWWGKRKYNIEISVFNDRLFNYLLEKK